MADEAQVQANDAAMDDMADEGRATDTVMAHLSNGEIVIPLSIVQSERAVEMIALLFELAGEDMEQFIVGNAKNKINPDTGHPEFFSFKSFVSNPIKTVVNVGKDVVKTTVNVAKDVISSGTKVVGNLAQGDISGAIKETGKGIEDVGSDLVAGTKQAVKDAYTGVVKQTATILDAVGLLPKVPQVNSPSDSSPSTVTQGDQQNQRQQAVTDVQAAAGGGASSLTPRTVAGPDNDYKLNKSAVLGL